MEIDAQLVCPCWRTAIKQIYLDMNRKNSFSAALLTLLGFALLSSWTAPAAAPHYSEKDIKGRYSYLTEGVILAGPTPGRAVAVERIDASRAATSLISFRMRLA